MPLAVSPTHCSSSSDWGGLPVGPISYCKGSLGLARAHSLGARHVGKADPLARASVPGRRHRPRGTADPGRGPCAEDGRPLPGHRARAFLLPNIPFILADPHAWLSGVLTPIASHTVPAGQGLVGLSLYLGLGGGSLAAFTVALVVVFLALLVSFIVTYPALKPGPSWRRRLCSSSRPAPLGATW